MTDNEQHQSSVSIISGFWQRIPLVVRAVVVGFFVFAIAGSLAWTAILIVIPAPWSLVVTFVMLWAYLKYTSGSGWPASTSQSRKTYFRALRLPMPVLVWSIVAALLSVVVFQSSLVIAFRLTGFPAEKWALAADFSTFPVWQVWLFILTAALVAAITEEVGFRGYMQVPLERRYHPAVSILIVSVVFVVAHLNQAWAGGVLIVLFAISVMWGVLALAAGSLIPVIIAHFVTDIFNFSYWWTDVAGTFDRRPIGETGIDGHIVVWIILFALSLTAFVRAVCITRIVRRKIEDKPEEPHRSPEPNS